MPATSKRQLGVPEVSPALKQIVTFCKKVGDPSGTVINGNFGNGGSSSSSLLVGLVVALLQLLLSGMALPAAADLAGPVALCITMYDAVDSEHR